MATAGLFNRSRPKGTTCRRAICKSRVWQICSGADLRVADLQETNTIRTKGERAFNRINRISVEHLFRSHLFFENCMEMMRLVSPFHSSEKSFYFGHSGTGGENCRGIDPHRQRCSHRDIALSRQVTGVARVIEQNQSNKALCNAQRRHSRYGDKGRTQKRRRK